MSVDCGGRLKVAILEHFDHDVHERALAEVFTALGLKSCFYRLPLETEGTLGPVILSVDGDTEETDYDADTLLSRVPLDVFISDISLGSSENYDGLEICRTIKEQYPDIVVIAISQHSLTFREAHGRAPWFDLFIDKNKINAADPNYKIQLVEKIRHLVRRNPAAKLDTESSELPDDYNLHEKKCDLERLLRQVTFTSHGVDLSSQVHDVSLRPLLGGFSSSSIFHMEANAGNKLPCIKAVLKVSKKSKAETEARNYNSFAKWYLPYTYRPELIGTGITKDKAAICYAFAYNGEIDFSTFGQCISDQDNAKISDVISQIFSPDSRRWYDPRNVIDSEDDLTAHYGNKWKLYKCEKSTEVLKRRLQNHIFNRYDIDIEGTKYSYPYNFLLGTRRGEYRMCIQHGDLHAGNILVTANKDISFIDFQHTGYGHIFEDFVFLECSIRTLFRWACPVETCIAAENQITEDWLSENSDNTSDAPYAGHISLIRNYALQNFPEESPTSYIYALCMCAYRMLQYTTEGWDSDQLIGCLFANMQQLSDIEENA